MGWVDIWISKAGSGSIAIVSGQVAYLNQGKRSTLLVQTNLPAIKQLAFELQHGFAPPLPKCWTYHDLLSHWKLHLKAFVLEERQCCLRSLSDQVISSPAVWRDLSRNGNASTSGQVISKMKKKHPWFLRSSSTVSTKFQLHFFKKPVGGSIVLIPPAALTSPLDQLSQDMGNIAAFTSCISCRPHTHRHAYMYVYRYRYIDK